MFFYEPTRVPLSWGFTALLLGAVVFSYPLLRTSRLIVQGDQIFVSRSRAFVWVLLGLVAVRLALRGYVENLITPMQTGALFYLLAFGMVARWRIAMLQEYRLLSERLSTIVRSGRDAWRLSVRIHSTAGSPPVPLMTLW